MVEKLLDWFERNGRTFPWRETQDPYRILIAEMMLQRTKAEQVVPVYRRFLEKFPTPFHISKATIEEIHKILQPLGLAWRAKKMHEMAVYIVEKHAGRIPDRREELLKVPGVGEYVADAVLCFGFGKNRAVLDSNVVRVLKRYYGMDSHTEARRDKKFRAKIDEILPEGRARDFNFAILDLAALICKPRNPLHEKCPLNDSCNYYIKIKNEDKIR